MIKQSVLRILNFCSLVCLSAIIHAKNLVGCLPVNILFFSRACLTFCWVDFYSKAKSGICGYKLLRCISPFELFHPLMIGSMHIILLLHVRGSVFVDSVLGIFQFSIFSSVSSVALRWLLILPLLQLYHIKGEVGYSIPWFGVGLRCLSQPCLSYLLLSSSLSCSSSQCGFSIWWVYLFRPCSCGSLG